MIKIVGCCTAIFMVLSVLWYLERFPFDSSSVDEENYFLAQTAQLADNMLLMEFEMVNDDQDDEVRKQLKETALFTNALLKKVALIDVNIWKQYFDYNIVKLTSDKKIRLKELRTALKANCIVLKREYKLAKILKDDNDLNKILKKAFAACKKGFEKVKGRSTAIKTKRIKELLQKTTKIYKGLHIVSLLNINYGP